MESNPRRDDEREKRAKRKRAAVPARDELPAALARSRIEAPVRAEVAGHGLEQVIGPAGWDLLVRHLPLPGAAREQPIGEPRRELLSDDRLDRREADPKLAPPVPRGPDDRACRDLGLEDRPDGLCAPRHAR